MPSSRRCPTAITRCSAGASAEPGTALSAGRRQILALARALVHRLAVLLLDEATSVIDNASDAAFPTVTRDRVLARGVAVLTVAHRLSSARDADRVIVLDKGRVVEAGSPIALMAGRGPFCRMARARGQRRLAGIDSGMVSEASGPRQRPFVI